MEMTHLLWKMSLNIKLSPPPPPPFCTSIFTLNFFKAFELYTQGKNNASPLCILCGLMPQIIPLLKFPLVCMWNEESTPWVHRPPLVLGIGIPNLALAIPSLIQSTRAQLGIGSGVLSSTSPPWLLVMVVITLVTHFKATIAFAYGPRVAALSTGLPQRARDSCHCGGENVVNLSIVYNMTTL